MKASKYYSLNLKKRPFQIFALTGIVLFALSFFSGDKTIGTNRNDTSALMSFSTIYRVLSGFFLLMWLLYLLIRKRLLSKKLIWTHALATILPILIAIICFNIDPQFNETPQQYPLNNLQKSKTDYWRVIYSLLLFISVSAQFVLILNIAGGMIKRIAKKRGRILTHDPN
jgi:glucan phosphoethanolaminetransferase (alkaline phosphatase superfamily)